MDKASHTITYGFIKDDNEKIDEVKKIKERVYLKCPYKLNKYDILRMKEENEN